ncbi:lipocalin-like [Tiliqua scincoides]|uniref:lipocalin-like n=1 Tax=Tiliqua scincoides TaxID=71010 RepID=UPI003462C4AB
MRTPFFSVLGLAILCLFQTQAEVPVQPGFQQDQFAGTWFSIGFASNSQWFKEKKSEMKMCTTVVTPLEDGNLDVTSTYPKLDHCETRKSIFVRTGQPGRFNYASKRTGIQHVVTVVETNYSEYAMLLVKKANDPDAAMVTLYGRSKELRPELLEKFTQLALAEELTNDDILILPRTGKSQREIKAVFAVDQCMEETV